jgi:hypothetical protein
MAKPTSKPDWTVGNPSFGTVTVEPSAGKKLAGWAASERPPFQFMNWLFWIVNDWINYFETTTDALLVQVGIFDAQVGTGGTHATLADLVADADFISGAIKNIIITSDQALSAPVTFNKNDLNIEFKPGVAVLKGIGAIKGLILTGERIRLLNGRFANFNAGGDIAVELSAASKYCMVKGNYFLNNDTDINDLGTLNILSENIDEV